MARVNEGTMFSPFKKGDRVHVNYRTFTCGGVICGKRKRYGGLPIMLDGSDAMRIIHPSHMHKTAADELLNEFKSEGCRWPEN